MRKKLTEALRERMGSEWGAQKVAAVEMGTSEANVSRWLNGSRPTDPEHWVMLAAYLGVNELEVVEMIGADQISRAVRSRSSDE